MRRFAVALAAAGLVWGQSADVPTILKRAVGEQQKGDLAGAIRDYEQVLRLRPHLVAVRTNLAAALAQAGRLDDAIQAYRQALGESPGDLKIRTNLAIALYKSGDAEGVTRELQPVYLAHPDDPEIAVVLADSKLQSKDCAGALDVAERTLKIHPEALDLLYIKGLALIRCGKASEGAECIQRVAQAKNSADAYLLAGVTQLNLGQIAPARENLDKAVRAEPGLPGALAWAGLARDRAGDEDGAKEAFQQALSRDPNEFDANLHLGAILYREHEYKAAKPFIDHALHSNPSAPMAQYASGLIEAAMGNTGEAVAVLESVVSHSPDWLEPRVKLSALYYKLGRDADGKREQVTVDQLNSEHRGKSSPFEK